MKITSNQTHQIKEHLISTVQEHYFLSGTDFEDHFHEKTVRDLDMDSIAMLEFFLVVENGFDLQDKISSRIEMNEMFDKSIEGFLDVLTVKVEEMLGEQEASTSSL